MNPCLLREGAETPSLASETAGLCLENCGLTIFLPLIQRNLGRLSVACSHNERRFNWINYMSGVKRNAFLSDLKREKTHICWNKRRQENMENEVFTPLLEQFMLTPLVCWVSSLISYSDVSWARQLITPCCSFIDYLLSPFQVKTVGHSTVTDGTKLSEYIELVDGIYLNEIMLEM